MATNYLHYLCTQKCEVNQNTNKVITQLIIKYVELSTVEGKQNEGCAHSGLVQHKSMASERMLGYLILKDEKLNILINNNYLTN